MSVQAMTWAYSREDITDPIEAFVLLTVANYADDYGICWPKVSTLVTQCRCCDRKLRDCLRKLEARGLLVRVGRRRVNASQRSNAIVLVGFEGRKVPRSADDHPVLAEMIDVPAAVWGAPVEPPAATDEQTACGAKGSTTCSLQPACGANPSLHVVPSLEPSLEPSKDPYYAPPSIEEVQARCADALDEIEDQCLDACGPGLCDAGLDAIKSTSNVLGDWIEEGFDLEADILPTIRKRTGRKRDRPIRTWDYFTEAIRAAHRRRLARAARGASAEKKPPGVSAPDPVERMARWINSDQFVPPSAVSNTMRDALLARGLVTDEALRRRQIY